MSQDPDTAAAGTAQAQAHETVRLLAGHRLVRALGKGGLGEVYEALAPDGRTVAVKAFLIDDDDQGLIAAAFVREATLGQRLEHRDIVRVFSSGCDGPYAYLTMEFVAGHDLRRHTRPGQLLPVDRVLRVVERVARALAAAHALNVIHRDIKPGNVLVDWPSDTVKVADFGLARLGDAFHSRTGIIAGTPSYMSPEQLSGGVLGPQSDLYSLGVVLFELLTGRLPHDSPSLGELLAQVMNREAPPLSSIVAGLPPALDVLVAELLDKRPAERSADAAALADRIARLREPEAPAGQAPAVGAKSRT